MLSNRVYEAAAEHLPYTLKELTLPISDGGTLTGFLHMPTVGIAPFPAVLMCSGPDTFQSDYYRLFRDYLAPKGIAMLTIDMPSIGSSSRWKLTQDTSYLHQ